MQGYCNMCGKCCEAITLWVPPEELLTHDPQYPNEKDESTDRGWARIHFHPITQEEAFRRNPFHRMVVESGRESYQNVYFYECDAYDKQTKRCTQHDKRPLTCWSYPHYGYKHLDGDWMPYSPTCDYIHDMPSAMKQEMVEIALELEAMR